MLSGVGAHATTQSKHPEAAVRHHTDLGNSLKTFSLLLLAQAAPRELPVAASSRMASSGCFDSEPRLFARLFAQHDRSYRIRKTQGSISYLVFEEARSLSRMEEPCAVFQSTSTKSLRASTPQRTKRVPGAVASEMTQTLASLTHFRMTRVEDYFAANLKA
jgi:hypothetical protein